MNALPELLTKIRIALAFGWPLFTVLRTFKGVGQETANEIADYAGIKR